MRQDASGDEQIGEQRKDEIAPISAPIGSYHSVVRAVRGAGLADKVGTLESMRRVATFTPWKCPLMSRFLRTHPVTSFAVLVFAIAYGVGLPVQIALGMFLPRLDATTAHYLGRVFIVGAPAIAALLLTKAAGDGCTKRWIAQLRPTPTALRWVPIAIIGGMAIITMAFLFGGQSTHTLQAAVSQAWPQLLPILLLEFVIVGIGEELGWRGWLLPTLLARGYSPLGASLCVGTLWGAWHIPILLQGPTVALAFMITVAGLSILQTALWLRTTGSVLVAAAAHAACNASFETLPGIGWIGVAVSTSVSALIVGSMAFKRKAPRATEASVVGD